MFDLTVRETDSRRMAAWHQELPALAGLVTAAWVAWMTCPEPRANSLTWSTAVAIAAGYVLFSAATGLGFAFVSPDPSGTRFSNLRLIAATVWLPPLALFISQKSPWAGLASIIVGWHIVTWRRFPRAEHSREIPIPGDIFQYFNASDLLPVVPGFAAACIAACAHFGAVTAAIARPVAAAACFGIGSAFLAWSVNRQRAPLESVHSPAARRTVLLLACAILFTLAGLMQYLPRR